MAADAAETERWFRLEDVARRIASAELKRWGGSLPADEIDRIATEAVDVALSSTPPQDGVIESRVAKAVRSAIRKAKRHARCERTGCEAAIAAAERGAFTFDQAKPRTLFGIRAYKLARDLEFHEAMQLVPALEDGTLHRASWLVDKPDETDPSRMRLAAEAAQHERDIYQALFADIARHSGMDLEEGRREKLVTRLVEFRHANVALRCGVCAPGSRWSVCEHTIPRFVGGKQISGGKLYSQGRPPTQRSDLLFKFGAPEVVDDPSVPYANYSSKYQHQDAAALLVIKALRLCGIDPNVRHVIERIRNQADRRLIRSFLGRWEAGADGELREKPPQRENWTPPGAKRKRARRSQG